MTDGLAGYRLEIIEAPGTDWQEAVYRELRQFNQTANPRFWEALDQPEHAAVPLHVFAFDQQSQVAGGLFATTQLLWLKLSIMSVRAELRGQRVGTAIMSMAETEATRRGCKYAFVDTMDYQAPIFYLKLGYQVVGQLDNWDSHGHAKLFLTKELPSST